MFLVKEMHHFLVVIHLFQMQAAVASTSQDAENITS